MMQPFDFLCQHCHGTLRVSLPQLVGRKVHCPHCRAQILVQEPESAGFSVGEQVAEGQIGSGLRLSAGSGTALADDDPSDQCHVWGDDNAADNESVLCGENNDWRKSLEDSGAANASPTDALAEDDPSTVDDDIHDLAVEDILESGARRAAMEQEASAGHEEAEVPQVEGADEDDDPPSVEIEAPRSTGRSSYRAPAPRGASQPNPMLMIGGIVGAVILMIVVGMAVTGKFSSGARSKSSAGKGHRRDPREFQDFARKAQRGGW
jgi:hypothetical protein